MPVVDVVDTPALGLKRLMDVLVGVALAQEQIVPSPISTATAASARVMGCPSSAIANTAPRNGALEK